MHSLSALASLTLCLGVSESSADGVRMCSIALVDSEPDIEGVGAGTGAVSEEGDLFFSLAVGRDMSR